MAVFAQPLGVGRTVFQVLEIGNQISVDPLYVESNVPPLVDDVKAGGAQVLGCVRWVVSCQGVN